MISCDCCFVCVCVMFFVCCPFQEKNRLAESYSVLLLWIINYGCHA